MATSCIRDDYHLSARNASTVSVELLLTRMRSIFCHARMTQLNVGLKWPGPLQIEYNLLVDGCKTPDRTYICSQTGSNSRIYVDMPHICCLITGSGSCTLYPRQMMVLLCM